MHTANSNLFNIATVSRTETCFFMNRTNDYHQFLPYSFDADKDPPCTFQVAKGIGKIGKITFLLSPPAEIHNFGLNSIIMYDQEAFMYKLKATWYRRPYAS